MSDFNRMLIEDAWQAVEQIPLGRVLTETKEEVLKAIEEPLKPAIGDLFDKNVETMTSSCNYSDYVKGQAWISMCWDSLSDENRGVVDMEPHQFFTMLGGDSAVGLFIPIRDIDMPEAIGQKALEIADRFSIQHTLWSKGWGIEEARTTYGGHGSSGRAAEGMSDEELIKALVAQGRYYDSVTGLFYLNRVHHKRATRVV